MNTIKQHSKKWEIIKQYNLGANDVASLLGVGFDEPSLVVESKINHSKKIFDIETLKLLAKGNRYESVVRNLCGYRNKVTINDTGLKRHCVYDFITASPDGYFTKNNTNILTEFKVRSELSRKIPEKYWVQMQTQMEVWNIDQCLYCENVIKEYCSEQSYLNATKSLENSQHGVINENGNIYYWSFVECYEKMVSRDQDWWNNNALPKIMYYWGLVEEGRSANLVVKTRSKRKTDESVGNEVCKRFKYNQDIENMVQPYMLSNYFRSDAIIDWLNEYGPIEKKDTELSFFLSMLRSKNLEFNHKIIEYITERFPESVCNISPSITTCKDVEPHKQKISFESIEKTKIAMDKKIPIIFNACFMSKVDSYFYHFGGKVDMLVLNSQIGDLFNLEVVPDNEDKYSIVNFKYATMDLRADGIHLLNNSKQKVYKAHLWLLNAALGITQGCLPDMCYLLGRKYQYTKEKKKTIKNGVFDHIATIDFRQIDKSYEEDCRKALDWIYKVRESGQDLDPFNPNCQEMYPNMKNNSDHPWRSYKSEIAEAIKEITLMYKCGPQVRQYALEKGVTEWSKLTPESIKFSGEKVINQITKFINVQLNGEDGSRLENRFIKNVPKIEFYLDFESIGNMYDDFSTFPKASNNGMIFLAGLVVVDNVNGTITYRSYLVDTLEQINEKKMLTEMLQDIETLRLVYQQNFAPIYAWSNAEKTMICRAMGKTVLQENNIILIDLCKCFRESGIVFSGQYGYGLKSVAKTMYEHEMIQTTWDVSNDVSDGLNAAIEAMKTYKYANPEQRKQYFQSVIDYNYVDCKVMEEIVSYMRRQSI
jgi:hypothetical protein